MSDTSEIPDEFARKQLGGAAASAAGAGPSDVVDGLDGAPPAPPASGPRSDDAADRGAKKRLVRLPCEDHNVTKFATEVGGILNKNGVFRRDDVVVTVNRERGVLVAMEPKRFRTYVEKHCTPAKFFWDKNGVRTEREMTMSDSVAGGTLASDAFIEQQRPLVRVNQVTSPVWRQSGADTNKIELLAEGYDEESRTFTIGSPGVVIDPKVTKEEAVATLRDWLLSEVPFGARDEVTKISRAEAVHIAAMVSVWAPALVPLLAARPGFLWMANAPRSGKTLLAKTVQIPVFGTAAVTPMKTDEEFDKVLDTAAIEARPVLFLDNLTGMLKSPSLDAFMTSPTRTGRWMGGQSSFSAPRCTQILITANNLGLTEDLEERFLICDLYLEEMDPRARKIKRPMNEDWLALPEVRSRILSALWALVRSWDEAGRPKGSTSIPGFETWSAVYGGIVEHAGFGNPLERPKLDHGGNDWKRDFMALLEELADDVKRPDLRGKATPEAEEEERVAAKARRSKEFTFADLIEASRALDAFTNVIAGKEKKEGDKVVFEADAKTRTVLGKYFGAQFGGRIGTLPDGRRVRFGSRGKSRHHRFIVELL